MKVHVARVNCGRATRRQKKKKSVKSSAVTELQKLYYKASRVGFFNVYGNSEGETLTETTQ